MDAKSDKTLNDSGTSVSPKLREPSKRSQGTAQTLTRFLNATPATAFQLWTEPAHHVHWCAPMGFSVLLCESDFRVGGSTQLVLHDGDGAQYRITQQWLRVDAGRRLVFNEQRVGSSSVDHSVLTTVTFEKLGNKTKLTVRGEPNLPCSLVEQAQWRQDNSESLDRFEQYLAQQS